MKVSNLVRAYVQHYRYFCKHGCKPGAVLLLWQNSSYRQDEFQNQPWDLPGRAAAWSQTWF